MTPHPNGQIVFARYDPALDDTVIYIVGTDGSGLHQAIPGTPIGGECPRWSPDGPRIATCGTALPDGQGGATMIIDARTGSYTQLAAPDPTVNTACNTWSPDAARLACEGWDDSNPARNGIYTIRSADGGDLVRVTANPTGGGHDLPGAYSPEGRRFLFQRQDADGNVIGLFVVNVNGTRLKQITPPGMLVTSSGSWSPQGNTIVFSMRIRAGQRNTIWTIHADGTGLGQVPVQPACGGSFDDPAWVSCSDRAGRQTGSRSCSGAATRRPGSTASTPSMLTDRTFASSPRARPTTKGPIGARPDSGCVSSVPRNRPSSSRDGRSNVARPRPHAKGSTMFRHHPRLIPGLVTGILVAICGACGVAPSAPPTAPSGAVQAASQTTARPTSAPGTSGPSASTRGSPPATAPDIPIFAGTAAIELKTGITRAGTVAFGPGGRLYVPDLLGGRILVFDPHGNLAARWGKRGSGSGELNFLRDPTDPVSAVGQVALDRAGNAYVTDTVNRRVEKFGASGKFLLQWGGFGGGHGQFSEPIGLTVDPNGKVLVVDDKRDDIQVFDGNGSYLRTIGSHGTGPGQLNFTGFIRTDGSGNVYNADWDNHRVQAFRSGGQFLWTLGAQGSGPGEFITPGDVAVGANGVLYVVDVDNDRITAFDRSRQLIGTWRPSTPSPDPATLGLAVDAKGGVFATVMDEGTISLLPTLVGTR